MKRVVIELPEGNDDVLSITAIGVNNNVSNMHVSTYIADLVNGTHLIHDGKKWIQKKEEYVPDISAGKINGWIPCSERLPEEDGNYIVTFEDGYVTSAPFLIDGDWELWCDSGEPIAWQPLPEPYQKGE